MIVRPNNKRTERAAFTLMEVMVVVAILVVLAGVGGVIFMRYQEDAYINVAKTQLAELTTACRTYQLKYGDYPDSLDQLVQTPDGAVGYVEATMLQDPWKRPYQYSKQLGPTGKPQIWSEGPNPGDQNSRISNQ